MSLALSAAWDNTVGMEITDYTPDVGPKLVANSGAGYWATLTGAMTVEPVTAYIGGKWEGALFQAPIATDGTLSDVTFALVCPGAFQGKILVGLNFAAAQTTWAGVCADWAETGSHRWTIFQAFSQDNQSQSPLSPGSAGGGIVPATSLPFTPSAGHTYNCRVRSTPYATQMWVDGVLVVTAPGTDALGIVPATPGTFALFFAWFGGAVWTLGQLKLWTANPRPTARNIPPSLLAAFEQPLLTLAMCVKVTRQDGTILGFTTHDRDIVLSGVTYEALAAVQASAIRMEVGKEPDNVDVIGLLQSENITESDLRAGLYDDAQVAISLCDWTNPALGSVTLCRGWIGDVTISEGQYTAAVRSLMQRLSQQVGELTSPTCRVIQLGDTRCKLNLSGNTPAGDAITSAGAITLVESPLVLHYSGGVAKAGFYTYGMLTFTSGLNAGLSREIKIHSASLDLDTVTATSPWALTNLAMRAPLTYTDSAQYDSNSGGRLVERAIDHRFELDASQ